MKAPAASELQRQDSGGISYVARLGGDGIPLVLLHGIGSNALSFAAMMQALPAGFPVIAWDAPGYGGSRPFDIDWPSPDHYAGAVAGLLDRLGWPRINLLGHSLGALVAGRFAVRYPERLAHLVLSSPALGYGSAPGAPLAAPAASRLDAMISEGALKFAATRGPRLVFDRSKAGLVAEVTSTMSEVKLPGYAHASRLLSSGDLLADAAKIATPTLVVVGAQDEVTPPANCRRVYDALMRANARQLAHRFELLDRAGHAAAQEQPEALARLVAAACSVSTDRAS